MLKRIITEYQQFYYISFNDILYDNGIKSFQVMRT